MRELQVPIGACPRSLEGLRIAHVSDFHFRRWNVVAQAAQDLLGELDYDLLVATGDFGNFRRDWRGAADLTRRFFGPLHGRSPIYAVLGNHDDPRIATVADVPITFLRNECQRLTLRRAELTLAGVEQCTAKSECLDRALDGATAPIVLLAHYPSTIFRLPAGRAGVSLVLSGHTHGGQIRLPGLGCLWPNDRIPRSMARGLHQIGGTMLHVTAGIGVSLPVRLRVNCPPEVAVLTLVASGQPLADQRRPPPIAAEQMNV